MAAADGLEKSRLKCERRSQGRDAASTGDSSLHALSHDSLAPSSIPSARDWIDFDKEGLQAGAKKKAIPALIQPKATRRMKGLAEGSNSIHSSECSSGGSDQWITQTNVEQRFKRMEELMSLQKMTGLLRDMGLDDGSAKSNSATSSAGSGADSKESESTSSSSSALEGSSVDAAGWPVESCESYEFIVGRKRHRTVTRGILGRSSKDHQDKISWERRVVQLRGQDILFFKPLATGGHSSTPEQLWVGEEEEASSPLSSQHSAMEDEHDALGLSPTLSGVKVRSPANPSRHLSPVASPAAGARFLQATGPGRPERKVTKLGAKLADVSFIQSATIKLSVTASKEGQEKGDDGDNSDDGIERDVHCLTIWGQTGSINKRYTGLVHIASANHRLLMEFRRKVLQATREYDSSNRKRVGLKYRSGITFYDERVANGTGVCARGQDEEEAVRQSLASQLARSTLTPSQCPHTDPVPRRRLFPRLSISPRSTTRELLPSPPKTGGGRLQRMQAGKTWEVFGGGGGRLGGRRVSEGKS